MRGLILSVLFLQVSVILTAPLVQWLHTNQIMPLQQQLLELQAMQGYQPMPQMEINMLNNPIQPLLIILPDDQMNSNADLKIDNQIERRDKEELKSKATEEDDSVVIDAKPIPTIDGRKAIILLQSGRFSIGDFISAIPFLPIEINVPDTISWIGNGISGVISSIGQIFPFQRPSQNIMGNVGVKSNINNMPTNNQYNLNIMKPILMLPMSGITGQIIPVQF